MMKQLSTAVLTTAALLAAAPVFAQEQKRPDSAREQNQAEAQDSSDPDEGKKIYKVRDDEGNVTFTDEPPSEESSEEVQLRKGNDMTMEEVDMPEPPEPEEDEQEEQPDYQVSITSPGEEETFQHPRNPVAVKYNVQPALKEGYSVEVLHNGEVLDQPSVKQPVRGEHKVRVRVLDDNGDVVTQSGQRIFYVHRPSRQLPPNN